MPRRKKNRLKGLTDGKPRFKKDVGLFQGMINTMHVPFTKEMKAHAKKEKAQKW